MTDEKARSNRETDRAISIVVLAGMFATIFYMVFAWAPPARSAETVISVVPGELPMTFAFSPSDSSMSENDTLQLTNTTNTAITVTFAPVPPTGTTSSVSLGAQETKPGPDLAPGRYGISCSNQVCEPGSLTVTEAESPTTSATPSPTTTVRPSSSPSASPTGSATPRPTTSPTASTSASPSIRPTTSASPSVSPSATSSASPSTSPSPSPTATAGPPTARTVTLDLRKHLNAKGQITAEQGASTDCYSDVTVDIQRKTKNGWRTIKFATTDNDGTYRTKLKDRKGKYRALVNELVINDVLVCLSDVSPIARHRHPR
jgi:hypothetical protein